MTCGIKMYLGFLLLSGFSTVKCPLLDMNVIHRILLYRILFRYCDMFSIGKGYPDIFVNSFKPILVTTSFDANDIIVYTV